MAVRRAALYCSGRREVAPRRRKQERAGGGGEEGGGEGGGGEGGGGEGEGSAGAKILPLSATHCQSRLCEADIYPDALTRPI